MKVLKIVVKTVLLLLITNTIQAQKWATFVREHEDAWFATPKAKEIAENVLLYQRNIGGWPKNIQMQNELTDAQKKELIALKSDTHNITTDNGATTQEMLYLSKMYAQFPEEKYKKAFLLGLNYILEAQYDNGGWPQFYPLKKGYYTHITYNDDSMVHIMEALEAIIDKTDYYSIKPDEKTIKKTRVAFNKGIVCILKTQYSQNGVLTAWCAQHDKETLLPAKARAYELPSLSGKESAKIVLLLMDIENPSLEVITAINSAVAWLEKTKITGIKIEEKTLQNGKKDRVVVADPDAKALWARFMELDDNTPFFCDRDGIKKATVAEISYERRNGYGWYTDQPKEVLKEYPRWEKKIQEIQLIKTQAVFKDEFNIVVDQNGNGDFKTIQQAINASKAYPSERITIFVNNGVYNEKIKVPEWNSSISLIGESREKTIITYDDHFNKIGLGRNSTFYTYTVLIEGNDFFCKNLTIQNTAGPVGQAVALNVNANRVMFTNCSFYGYQDTLYTSGEGNKNYFKDCYIEGTTDFIFGDATALFENCVINSKSDSYITAASTTKDAIYGYVFKNCKLISDANVTKAYLGRQWRPYAKTVFMNCEMGKHILPQGWHNWSKPDAETTSFYAEYQCTGEGYQPKNRVAWSHQLKNSKAKKYTIENILDSDTAASNKQWYLRNN